MIRTFVAVDLPAEFHEKIFVLQSKFIGPGLRPVSSNLVHITLKFLGDVDEAQLPQIISTLNKLDCLSFDSHIFGINAFPSLKNPRVVWLGVDGDYSCIHGQVESLLSEIGFKKDTRKFTSHATIARATYLFGSRKKDFLSAMESLRNFDVGSMHVDTIKLKKSTLTPQGPIYETLHEVKLL